jgi:hypothetical protein
MRKREKYCRAGQATDDNMTHAHCMLDIKGYKHTHTNRICNTLLFHGNNSCTDTPQYYVILILPVLLIPRVI